MLTSCTPLRLGALAANLQQVGEDLWATTRCARVSYPEDASAECFAVESDSFWFRHRNQCVLAVVRRHAPAGPIFDVGGGNGCVAAELVRAGFPTVVVEPSPEGIRNARSRGLAPLVQATFEDAGFHEASLPAIGLFDVLEHVEDDRDFLRHIARTLVPGGLLYLTVPCGGWLWSEEDSRAGHFRRYSIRGLCGRLRQAGLRVAFASHCFSFLVPPILLLRTLPRLVGLRRRTPAAQIDSQHQLPAGAAGRVLSATMQWELRRLASGRCVTIGSSCLVVARSPGGGGATP